MCDDSERSLASLARAYYKYMFMKELCMANATFCYLNSVYWLIKRTLLVTDVYVPEK